MSYFFKQNSLAMPVWLLLMSSSKVSVRFEKNKLISSTNRQIIKVVNCRLQSVAQCEQKLISFFFIF